MLIDNYESLPCSLALNADKLLSVLKKKFKRFFPSLFFFFFLS